MLIQSVVEIHHHISEIWPKFIFGNFCRVTLTFDLGDLIFGMQVHIAYMYHISHTNFDFKITARTCHYFWQKTANLSFDLCDLDLWPQIKTRGILSEDLSIEYSYKVWLKSIIIEVRYGQNYFFCNFCGVTLTFDLGDLILGMQVHIAHMYHIGHTNFEFINYSTNMPLFLTENSKLTFWPLWPWPLTQNQNPSDTSWGP